jgi:hypothetical protein
VRAIRFVPDAWVDDLYWQAQDKKTLKRINLLIFVETHAGVDRIQLKIEDRGFDGLLLIVREFGQAVREGVGDTELHWSGLHR